MSEFNGCSRTSSLFWTSIVLTLTFLCDFSTARRPLFFITAPSVMRYDVEETIVVSWFHENHRPIKLRLYMQDYPDRSNTFNVVRLDVPSNEPNILTMKVKPSDLPLRPERRKYVYLVALSSDPRDRFREEAIILLNPNNGYLFVQTDKPVYTPDQNVLVRVLPLVQRMAPSKTPVNIVIQNPNGVTMERRPNVVSQTGFIDISFHIPEYTTFGKWTVTVSRHQVDYIQNATANFEVKKYVIPTFSVKILPPRFILPQDIKVKGQVTANYVFGKPVVGRIMMKYYVLKVDGTKIKVTDHSEKIADGKFNFNIPQREFGTLWNSIGSRLFIEAAVTEDSSGKIVMVTDRSALFVGSPYKISLRESKKYYHPGSTYQVKVSVEWAHGKPANGVSVTFNATTVMADGRPRQLSIAHNMTNTNSDGQTYLLIPVPKFTRELRVIVKTDDDKYLSSQQSDDVVVAHPYESRSGSFVSLTVDKINPMVGKNVTVTLRTNKLLTKEISLMGLSKGRVVMLKAINISSTDPYNVNVTITDLMPPSVRFMAYYVRWSEFQRPEVVADSIWLDVEDECRYESSVLPDKDTYKPGDTSNIDVLSTRYSHVGLLGVDTAVYILKDSTILTPEKVFKSMTQYDVGCGAGGGSNSNQVFKDAGLAVISNTNLNVEKRSEVYCSRANRRRMKRDTLSRSASLASSYRARRRLVSGGAGGTNDIESLFVGYVRYCCRKGKQLEIDIGETCRYHTHRSPSRSAQCLQAFMLCCENERVSIGAAISGNGVSQQEKTTSNTGSPVGPAGNRGLPGQSPLDQHGRIEGETFQFSDIEGRDVDERTFFPETWISSVVYTGANTKASFAETVPDSITTWSLSAISVSSMKGLCISKPKTIKAFKPFFIDIDMPYEVIRNEQIELKATIFNYDDHNLPVNISLRWMQGVCTHAERGGWTPTKELRIAPHQSVSVTFPIIPLEVGIYNVSMQADSPLYSDAINKTLTVLAEGAEKVVVVSKLLDPSGKMKAAPQVSRHRPGRRGGRPRTRGDINRRVQADDEDVFDFINRRQISWVDLSVPKDAVSGSVVAKLTITGSILGPTVQTIIGGMDTMIKLPTGCGEQTMIALAPTVYATRYLKLTNKLTEDREKEAVKYMNEGYKKQMVFMKRDGSFSVWPNFRSSTWLTAFVVKVFCQTRDFIEVDESVICTAVDWLTKSSRSNGAFHETYKVLHRHMLGGLKGRTALTAFVLIAMKECNCQLKSSDRAIRGATVYLERKLAYIEDSYSLALVTYALAMAGSPRSQVANARLRLLSKFNLGSQSRHWPVDEAKHNIRHSHRMRRKSTWYRDKPSGLAIETAAYALLAQLKLGEFEYSKSIAIWLIEQRNSHGAFASTQDTVIGLQALSQYDIQKQSERLQLHARIYFDAAISNITRDVYIDNGNELNMKEVANLPLGGNMYIETSGTGIGQLQVELRYNVDKIDKKQCKFNLKVEAIEDMGDIFGIFGTSTRSRFDPGRYSSRIQGRRFYQRKSSGSKFRFESSRQRIAHTTKKTRRVLKVKTCVKALIDDMSEMAIIDVGLFTGYKPRIKDLDKLKNTTESLVQNYHHTERSVIFYMSKLPKRRIHCFEFGVTEERYAGTVHSVAVSVYDYYEPDTNCATFYHINNGSPNLETSCQGDLCTCAEGKCPVCYGLLQGDKKPISFAEMKRKACRELDYAFKGVVLSIERVPSGLEYIIKIQDVFHKGKEDVKAMETGVIFTRRSSCPANCPRLSRDKSYLFIGRDGPKHKDEYGNEWYKYFLEDETYVIEWIDNMDYQLDYARRQLAVDLDRLKSELQLVGC